MTQPDRRRKTIVAQAFVIPLIVAIAFGAASVFTFFGATAGFWQVFGLALAVPLALDVAITLAWTGRSVPKAMLAGFVVAVLIAGVAVGAQQLRDSSDDDRERKDRVALLDSFAIPTNARVVETGDTSRVLFSSKSPDGLCAELNGTLPSSIHEPPPVCWLAPQVRNKAELEALVVDAAGIAAEHDIELQPDERSAIQLKVITVVPG